MALGDWEFEVGGVKLGASAPFKLTDFDLGETVSRAQDFDNPVESTKLFGRGLYTPPTWRFSVAVLGDAFANLSLLHQVWVDEYKSDQDILITYRIGGRERVTFGVPRSIVSRPKKGVPNRLIEVSCEFALTSNYSYDTIEQSSTISLFTEPTGFFTAPFIAPIITVPSRVETTRVLPPGGNTPAPFKARVYGPIKDFYLAGEGWVIDTNAELSSSQWAELDTRKNTLMRNDGVSLGGTLNRFSRLSDIRINHMGDYIRLGGIDPSATARMVVSWRNTYSGI